MGHIFFFLSVFLAGILSFFSPCILPLLPVYTGVLLDDKDGAQASSGKFSISVTSLLRTLVFIAGISFIFILLGYGAGFLGDLLYASWFQYLTGAIIILLGLHQMEILHFKGLYKEKRLQLQGQGQNGKGYSQAFLLGLTFSFAWTPCVGPVLGSVLALAASGGSGAWQGAGLMLVYTLGLALPFLLLALTSSYVLKHFRKLHPYLGILKKVGGFLIIVMGFLVLFGNASILSQLFE
ncbi:TPA: thiol-disulfide oxidoreductase-associated membrane protein CcdA2 [Streptococcus pneumoniae]|uniref:thiol-disulfide oxidoreductase-associated membrane protein CcdA2 n=1 Tax=Streptococcus pneumoniae TaxID=1313 RepID=UPI0005DD41C6|nr:thiol-disulfide oxidoreductase-associated membrane protein CcdA2 [Streptococcus pneumoniae]OYL00532.1 cytochrome c biogenesis protein CcdA [Streptococcus pneumoniae E709]MBW5074893.1 thiol-disulfide oxidoreductase-associated membrane protein CcdA2 [Streptococcus pneumoniae]MBW5077442.1 thiol-disulfide oxidoreductase-associated membrane protein CcdA2 [Streptococcus pneumoniae]MBW5205816.1 thiol-disulfide oxidoreductase-associated membrane protein CcdA2 [Streptococcus pneumoniae]MCL9790389.1 